MSAYQKFIDSAPDTSPPASSRRNSKTMRSRPQQNSFQLTEMSPTKLMTSSTPLNKDQCWRLFNHSTLKEQARRIQATKQQMRAQRDAYFQTDDPVLLKWLQAMRYETDLETISTLHSGTLAIDQHAASALSIRDSQVTIQELRLESNFLIDYIDYLIEALPLDLTNIERFTAEFSELWKRLMSQTNAQTSEAQLRRQRATSFGTPHNLNRNQNLTIINCTPRKSQAAARSLRPLDELITLLREHCIEIARQLEQSQEQLEERARRSPVEEDSLNSTPYENLPAHNHMQQAYHPYHHRHHYIHQHHHHLHHHHHHHHPHETSNLSQLSFDHVLLESLRKLKELYGRFVEVAIRTECSNIVQGLNYDFSQSSLNRLSSSSSLQTVRPFESSRAQLPLKWALIALWQLTKDDTYICRVLTERWRGAEAEGKPRICGATTSSVAKRLDYSTKYDTPNKHSQPRSEYEKLYQICPQLYPQENDENRRGALSSALKQVNSTVVGENGRGSSHQMSTIELLIEVIIKQPNKHERLDMMNFMHARAQSDKLIDIEEWDQVSAAIFTSNQYKVAGLRILNHLCSNDHAIKTILRCFSTPPPDPGQPMPENKIIRSIFECYQTAQEHIYQNETMFHQLSTVRRTGSRGARKRSRQQVAFATDDVELSEYSDYGSCQTTTVGSGSGSHLKPRCNLTRTNSSSSSSISTDDEGDDVVVKEAIRLLVQLTNPFHKSNQALDYYTLIGRFSIDSLVKYLTNIIKSTVSREMLFLSLTALANISFITTDPIKHYGTNGIMLEMFRTSKTRAGDLELRDQAVTILANTADKNLVDVVQNGGLTFLLSCLESCPNKMVNYKPSLDRLKSSNNGQTDGFKMPIGMENKPRDRKPIDLGADVPELFDCACDQQQAVNVVQSTCRMDLSPPKRGVCYLPVSSSCLSKLSAEDLGAMERIHQKTAVAFARMSSDPSSTGAVLKYGGVKQMIDLCKFSHKRNHSDTVLIACIAALRKMAKIIESDTFRYYNALDLIELDLNRALEIYGSPREDDVDDVNNTVIDARGRLFVSDV